MRPTLLAVVGLLLLGAAHAVPGAAGGKGAPSGELLEHGAGDAADSEVWPPFAAAVTCSDLKAAQCGIYIYMQDLESFIQVHSGP